MVAGKITATLRRALTLGNMKLCGKHVWLAAIMQHSQKLGKIFPLIVNHIRL